MTNLDLTRLRELAEKASPGPWFHTGGTHIREKSGSNYVCDSYGEKDRDFIEAANPATILALLDEIESLQHTLATCRDKCRRLEKEADWLAKEMGSCNKEDTPECSYPFPDYLTQDCCPICWREAARKAVEGKDE